MPPMIELQIKPVIIVKDELRRGRPPAWRDLHRRLSSAASAEDAAEAIGALRELLQLEDLLVAHDPTGHS